MTLFPIIILKMLHKLLLYVLQALITYLVELILHKFYNLFEYILFYIFFRESILNGSPDLKENASHGLAEVIKLTSPEALKPSVVHITGPLIRILGDRFGANVKTGTSYFRPG